MAYTRTQWEESVTPLSAQNFNNIEDGIEELQNGKVDKVSGKGLSTNDYTTAEKTKLNNIFDGDQFVIVTDNGTISSLQAGSRQAYSINLATEYNIPSDGSYIPIGFLTIYPQFIDDKCVIQAFDLYAASNGQIWAVINICNYGSSNYSNVTMRVKILLWKK